jgi:GNAT superfamily N-acetyltransferase
MIAINRVRQLPDDFGDLVDAANAESMGMVARLAAEFAGGANRFDGPGEGLWEARSAGQLIGMGGLNIDPFAAPDERCGRVRRLYVLPEWRRGGVATALLEAISSQAAAHFAKLTAYTTDRDVVGLYLACGFVPVTGVTKRSVERNLAAPS